MAHDEGPLEHLREDVYSREGVKRSGYDPLSLAREESTVRRDWEHNHPQPSTVMPHRKNTRRFAIGFFIIALVFFLGAALVAAFVITRGGTFVSSRNVTIEVLGPVSVSGGARAALDITVTNKNSAALERADLVVVFPEGTRSAGAHETLTRVREPLGEIGPGEHATHRVEALFFGEEGAELQVEIAVEYRLAGSNALFENESVYELEVSSAPISLFVSLPAEVTSGQEIEFLAEIISNAQEALPDVVLSVEYPPGFFLVASDPAPDVADRLWRIGELSPGDRRTISMSGTLEGQDGETRVLHFSLGLGKGSGSDLETVLLKVEREITVSRPFVTARLSVNSVASDVVILEADEHIRGEVFWQNNLPVSLEDVVVEAELQGAIIDERTVRPTGGSYRSSDNTIVWTKADVGALARVSPGGFGRLGFEFDTVALSRSDAYRAPSFTLLARVSGRRVEGGATGPVSSEDALEGRIATVATARGRAVYSIGPFENEGPLPPQAEERTTYTIFASIVNTANDLDSAVVTLELPANAEWRGVVDPAGADVSFDAGSRIVRWDAGVVPAGAGYSTPPEEIAFQIALVPSVTDVGEIATLVLGGQWSGTDRFTNTTRSGALQGVTSLLSTDPLATDDDAVVAP